MQILRSGLALSMALSLPCGSAFAITRGEALHETGAAAKATSVRTHGGIDNIDLRQSDIQLTDAVGDLAAARMETELGVLPVQFELQASAPTVRTTGTLQRTEVTERQERPQAQEERGSFRRAISGLASLFKAETSGARFDQALVPAQSTFRPEAAAAWVTAPTQGSVEYQKISNAFNIALSQGDPSLDVGVAGMFQELKNQGKRPNTMLDVGAGSWHFRTAGDDPENQSEPKQIILSQAFVLAQSEVAIAAALSFGIAKHFFAMKYPESAEKHYIALSVMIRDFINKSGQTYGNMRGDPSGWIWTPLDGPDESGFPYVNKLTQRWKAALSPNADDVRRGDLFAKHIIQRYSDPSVYIRDSRTQKTLSGRYSSEPSWGGVASLWQSLTGKAFSQVISDAQNAFDGFVRKEVEWFQRFRASRP